MVLSDVTILEYLAEGRIVIDPLDLADVQPASVDLRLGPEALVFSGYRQPYIDVRQEFGGSRSGCRCRQTRLLFCIPGNLCWG